MRVADVCQIQHAQHIHSDGLDLHLPRPPVLRTVWPKGHVAQEQQVRAAVS